MPNRPHTTIEQNPNEKQLEVFLRQLNLTRRKLSLYPSNHPQIKSSITDTLVLFNALLNGAPELTLGIAPATIYLNNCRLDQKNPVYSEFADFFSRLGVASIGLHQGLDARELIRFHQFLHTKGETLENDGSFANQLEEQQITHIRVRMVDYSAFQARETTTDRPSMDDHRLWEDFLHGLENGILDFDENTTSGNFDAVVELINRKFTGTTAQQQESGKGIRLFMPGIVTRRQQSDTQHQYDKKLNMLLEKLSPEARNAFLNKGLQALDRQGRNTAKTALQRISPTFLEGLVSQSAKGISTLSPRLLDLINSLSGNSGNTPAQKKQQNLSSDSVRARLDILFKEEQTERYMPENYQRALHSAMTANQRIAFSPEVKEELLEHIQGQSIEQQSTLIILELLQQQPDPERVPALQEHLLQLSRFFLEAGEYSILKDIYRHWSEFINSERCHFDIFSEKLLANHTQLSFMTDVLDGLDTWGKDKEQEISDYILLVGESYCELIVERLGLAPEFSERRLWINILTRISGNAQQKIIPCLSDKRWYLVRNLVTILGTELSPTSIKAIQSLCSHPHPQVRSEAIRVLFTCNPATANRKLLEQLHNKDDDFRIAAVSIADLSSSPEVLALLHHYLETEPATSAELELQKAVVATLCRRGEKESLVILRRILQRSGLLLNRNIRRLQEEIIHHLGSFQHPAADKLLQELATGRFRRQAFATISRRQEGSV